MLKNPTIELKQSKLMHGPWVLIGGLGPFLHWHTMGRKTTVRLWTTLFLDPVSTFHKHSCQIILMRGQKETKRDSLLYNLSFS